MWNGEDLSRGMFEGLGLEILTIAPPSLSKLLHLLESMRIC